MTHAQAFATAGPNVARDPAPSCPGRLDLVGRFWGTELVEVMRVRRLYQCSRCHALIGFVGEAPVWAREGKPR